MAIECRRSSSGGCLISSFEEFANDIRSRRQSDERVGTILGSGDCGGFASVVGIVAIQIDIDRHAANPWLRCIADVVSIRIVKLDAVNFRRTIVGAVLMHFGFRSSPE